MILSLSPGNVTLFSARRQPYHLGVPEASWMSSTFVSLGLRAVLKGFNAYQG